MPDPSDLPFATRDEDVTLREMMSPGQADIVALIEEYYRYDHIPFQLTEVSLGVKTILGDPTLGRIFLIFHRHELAGYVILAFGFDIEFGGKLATVTDMYLRPHFRRRGIGTRVFELLEKISLTLGLRALELQPERNNSEARAFYAKLGFTPLNRIPMCKRLG